MADSVWSCKEEFGSACKGLPADKRHEGKQYCVLHFPSVDKDLAEFKEAIEEKLKAKDFDFRGVYFPGSQSLASFLPNATFEGTVDFSEATFKKRAYFYNAIFKKRAYFSEANFEEGAEFHKATFGEVAYFYNAIFKEIAYFSEANFEEGAYFSSVTFEELAEFSKATFGEVAEFSKATFKKRAYFYNAIFKKRAYFSEANFEGEVAYFYNVTFGGEAYFSEATFGREAEFSGVAFEEGADFYRTIFKEKGSFSYLRTSSQTFLSFRSAVIEKPERLSFHSTHLRPSWFIDVDAQKFDFSDVEWFRLPDGDELKLEKEIEALEAGFGEAPTLSLLRKLQKACRKLMNNAEENRDYPAANEFHYWSMELLRKEGWRRLGLVGAFYWALSGYGERPRRAFWILVGMWVLFALCYMVWAPPRYKPFQLLPSGNLLSTPGKPWCTAWLL